MSKRIVSVALVVSLLVGLAGSAQADLITNGGMVFTGGDPNYGGYINGYSTGWVDGTVQGWNTTDFAQLVNPQPTNYDFTSSFFGVFTSSTNTLYQLVTVTTAGPATLSLQAAKRIGGSNSSGNLFFDIANISTQTALTPTSSVEPVLNGTVQNYSKSYMLAPGMYAVAVGGTSSDGTFQMAIDNVSLNMVPEPTSLMLLVTGVLGLLAYAWRRRK